MPNLYFRTQTPEMLTQAYKHGTYSKIHEFVCFRRRLADSLVKVSRRLRPPQRLLMKFTTGHAFFPRRPRSMPTMFCWRLCQARMRRPRPRRSSRRMR
jgi:hypothetical protein